MAAFVRNMNKALNLDHQMVLSELTAAYGPQNVTYADTREDEAQGEGVARHYCVYARYMSKVGFLWCTTLWKR
jgi:hypothetical protein